MNVKIRPIVLAVIFLIPNLTIACLGQSDKIEFENKSNSFNPFKIEYEESYESDDPNILIDQSIFKKFTLYSDRKLNIKKIKRKGGMEEIIEEQNTTIPIGNKNLMEEIREGLLRIPEDNPWSSQYLWAEVKSYTVANIDIVGFCQTKESHKLKMVVKVRDLNSEVKGVVDLPQEVVSLIRLLKDNQVDFNGNFKKN
jgi:hypothetical protein